MIRKLRLLAALPPPQLTNEKTRVPTGALSIASVLERQGVEVEVVDLQLVGSDPREYDVTAIARKISRGAAGSRDQRDVRWASGGGAGV